MRPPTFGQALLLTLSKTYALRMAAVFMISLATIWLKTGLMPRWLVGVTYLVAVGLLLASDISMWITLAFPTWVLVVSVLLLVRAGVIDLDRDVLSAAGASAGKCQSSEPKACDGHSFTASRACSSSSGTSSTSTITMPSSS